jgi:hypothetical protein
MPPPDKPFTGGERPVQRMNYANNAADRGIVAFALAAVFSPDVISQLMDEGGIGATTIRTLGTALVTRLLGHTTAAHFIAIVLALDEAKIRRLDQLEQAYGDVAFNPFIALAEASLDTLLDPLPNGRPLDDIVPLATRFSAANARALTGAHAAIDVAGLIQIGTAAGGVGAGNRALADLVQLANGVTTLTATQVLELAGIHAAIDVAGLIQIGTAAGGVGAGNRARADLIQLANGVPALTATQVLALAGIHAAMDTAGLIQIGTAAGGVAVNNRALADLVLLANGVPGLTATQVLALAGIHAAIDIAGLIGIGTAAGGVGVSNRALADLIQFANGVPAFTADQVLALAGIHAAIDTAGLIQIGLASAAGGGGARPLADLVLLANAAPVLTAAELGDLALQPRGGALGEAFILNVTTNASTAAQLAGTAHAATMLERQAVLNDATLRSVIRANLGNSATIVMSALLESSQQWVNPTGNDFFAYFYTNLGTGTLPNAATMNCWESILYAAYLAELIDTNWIHDFYDDALTAADANQQIWTALGFANTLPEYPAAAPTAGQLLFYLPMGDVVPSHVSLSLGGHDSMSLWNEPNTIDVVQRITINQLRTPGDQVFFTDPPW